MTMMATITDAATPGVRHDAVRAGGSTLPPSADLRDDIPPVPITSPPAAAPGAREGTFNDRRPLLHLLAWLSPAFPTGAFAYSHGLEWAVEAGDVADPGTLQQWLTDILTLGSGRSDTILLRCAHRNAADPIVLSDLAQLALATSPARERRDEALNQGRAFILAVAAWIATPLPPDLPYAVAVGAAAGGTGISEDDTAVAYLQAFAANLVSAAVRLVPLGQTAGLRVLAALEPVIISVSQETAGSTPDDVGGCAFRSDLAAMRHETQYTRLFRS